MKEEITRIMGKTLPLLLVSILLIVSAPSVNAHPDAVISVDPSYLEVDIGETFTVNVNISNVEDPGLYGYELKIYYNDTLLDATDAEYPSGHFLDGAAVFETPPIFEDNYVLIGAIFLGDVPGATGSGVLATFEFNGTSAGDVSLEIKGVVLLDPDGIEMGYSVNDGSVTVIPEFTSALMIFMFMAITLVVVMLKKLTASEKRNAYRP